MSKKKKAKKSKKTPKKKDRHLPADTLCSRCKPAKCCQYLSLEIDRPRSLKEYDELLWFLAHEDISIYIWKRAWYLMVHNPCNFLDRRTNLCAIYDSRPRICREHSTEECEFDSEYDFDEHFKSYDELKRWMIKKNIIK